jgi:hypothetical protein
MDIGRSIVHLYVYTPNLLDAEASYQCPKDFASSIKNAQEPESELKTAMLSGRAVYILGPL